MDVSVFLSLAVLLITAVLAFYATRLVLHRLPGRAALWAFVAGLWIAMFAGILVVDINVPLAESHFYSEGGPAPVWVVVLAMFLRSAALASIVLARPRIERI